MLHQNIKSYHYWELGLGDVYFVAPLPSPASVPRYHVSEQ